ncbi:torsin-1A-interacting protein 1-like [Stegastes partitus]|uniref:Torsin-1A-interacting protein 1-like n=1 Tax=Stegastes partitus TaxID=144197 RepID=A0A3B4ZX33_9TELE|nr:PREDICTED: torsin-1A-interacting protein 1-like [Stegastes partitus]
MDSKVSEGKVSRPLRRSARQTTVKGPGFEATPRSPLKRTKKGLENKAPGAAVNGSKDEENDSEEEEQPRKKSRLDTGGPVDGRGDENEMDVQESAEAMEKNGDQEINVGQDSPPDTHLPETRQGHVDLNVNVNFNPLVVLGERCQTSRTINEDSKPTNKVKPSAEAPAPPTKPPMPIRPPANRYDAPKITSMAEYRRTMEGKVKSTATPRVNHLVPGVYPASQKSCTMRQRVNDIPTQSIRHKKQEGLKKAAVARRSSGNSSRGFKWCLWILVLLVLLNFATFLAYKFIPVLQKRAAGGASPSRVVKPEEFADHLSLLETQFPSQRPELWKRSKIHLEKHLKTAQPTEPVSLILTAGRTAGRTLGCLAQALASSFSSALNASVLHIHGASKAGQDSDEVKLDIDYQLQAAFEGEKPVAVIHRFEELPPGSTLIFYRYCDHENAAYKQVFLLFTVLLPQDEVSAELSLKEVEEMVQDYVKERLVGSSSQAAFNKMDTDKYGGLWSRISHLTLPVVSEEEVEQKGC